MGHSMTVPFPRLHRQDKLCARPWAPEVSQGTRQTSGPCQGARARGAGEKREWDSPEEQKQGVEQ